MEIKAVIFDVGGVLVEKVFGPLMDGLAVEYNLNSAALHKYSWSLFDKVNQGEMTEKELFENIIEKFNIPISASLLEEKSMQLKPIKKVWEYVRELKNRYTLAILSNLGKSWSIAREEQFHISNLFDEVVWSCDLGISKPNKQIFNYLINKLNINPGECVFIDDKQSNINAAQSLGMKGILYQNPQQLEQELALLGVYIKSKV